MPIILGVVALGFLLFMTKNAAATDEVDMDSPGFQQYGDVWRKYESLFKDAAAKYGIDWKWLKAIAIIESSLGTDPLTSRGGVSSDGKSWGLMQVTLTTARDLDPDASPALLNDPIYSIDLAARYVGMLQDMFPGNERKIIMSYNQGPGNTQKGKEYAAGYFTKWSSARSLVEGG